jgi:3D-(3,5/4)-trihydroxycyclohexane-1,2-dione acylhydrolase (decyclizing)
MSRSNQGDTIHLTVAQALAKYLSVQYSEFDEVQRRLIPAIFGIFGHGNVAGLGQALEEHSSELPYYQPRNEQSMVHTALGYAKANRRLATLACTSSIGPGACNMVTGAATATINRLPVLLIPADYYATRHQGVVLQQLEHPISADVSVNDTFRPVSRFFDRISRPEQLLTALPEAMRVLTDPAETGAVTIALPQDVQSHAYHFPAHFFAKRVWRIERRLPDRRRIEEAAAMLRAAKRPLIIAGGGVHYSECWDELEKFAESFGIPVGETLGGKGAMRRASDLTLGGLGVTGTPAAAKLASTADVVLAVGTRLNDFATGSRSAFNEPGVRFIHINVEAHDAYKMGALPVVADAREGLRALKEAAAQLGVQPDKSYVAEVRKLQQAWVQQVRHEVYCQIPGEAMSQGQLVEVLNEEAQSGDTIVAAAGSPPGDLHKLWDVSENRKCYLEFGFSCMGFELPAGIGVRMAQKAGDVYVYIGDGTYFMNPTELVTATQENLKITVVISENHGYQVIRQLQMGRAGRSFGNEFRHRDDTNRLNGEYVKVDIAQNASSMGARSWHVTTPEAFRAALREARQERRSCVIVVETEKHRYLPGSNMWWDVAPAEVTTDETTQRLRADYEESRGRLQRFYY